MHDSNDDEFEAYLKSFVPLNPIALPQSRSKWFNSGKVRLLLGTIAAGLAIVVTEIVVARIQPEKRVQVVSTQAVSARGTDLPPLTIGSANRWLVSADSLDGALDSLPFGKKGSVNPTKNKSAVAVLRQEDMTL